VTYEIGNDYGGVLVGVLVGVLGEGVPSNLPCRWLVDALIAIVDVYFADWAM